jgi:protein-disulfide isomerase
MKPLSSASVALLAVVACGGAAPRPPTAAAAPSAVAPAVHAVEPVPSEEDAVVPISPGDPTWGSRTALVTIVEFADFQCPYSSRVEGTLDQVRTTYGSDQVRIVWKNNPLPFHKNAIPAAEAAVGVFALAGNDAFWRFHDTVFKNQALLSDDVYESWAKDAGLSDQNLTDYKAGLASHKWADKIAKDLSDGRAAGVQGTPSFFIDGVFINGAQPFDTFKEMIDQELEKAKDKVASGVSKARLYVEMSNEYKKKQQDRENEKKAREDEEAAAQAATVFKVPVGTSPVLGNPGALVTVVEFADFQCQFCGRVELTLKALRDKYGDKVRFVWKNEPLPFHLAAEPAAEAALEMRVEAGDKGFWALHDKLFASQKDLIAGQAPDVDAIVQMAVELGGNPGKVRRAISVHAHKNVLDADQDLADDLQARGTPQFFIDGRRLVGAQPQERFEKIIDEEVKKAQDLIAAGTQPSDLYAVMIKDGKGPPEPERKDVPSGLPTDGPVRGNTSARVTIHEWADFQCTFCGRVEPTLAQVMKDYGGRVKLVWHDLVLPMHSDAPLAAEAGREAYAQKGPSAFWAIHDKMFANHGHLKRDDLDRYAKESSLNMNRWKKALDASAHAAQIDADTKAGNDVILGTPVFLIVPQNASSGYFINGAQEYTKFRKLIERALAESGAKPVTQP